jgi:hypothetical protein
LDNHYLSNKLNILDHENEILNRQNIENVDKLCSITTNNQILANKLIGHEISNKTKINLINTNNKEIELLNKSLETKDNKICDLRSKYDILVGNNTNLAMSNKTILND